VSKWTNKPLPGTPLIPGHRQLEDLIGWWLFQEGAGGIANDLSGNNNPGRLYGFTIPASATSGWGPGKFSKTLTYDNVGDYISIGDLDIFNFGQTDGFTVMAWVRSTQPSLGVRPILSKYTNASTPGWYLMESYDAGQPQLTFTTILPVSEVRRNYEYRDHVWYHVAAVKDTSTDTVKMYVNGNLLGSNPDINVGGHANASPLVIGKLLSYYYQGQIDDVRVYNRPLIQPEIQNTMDKPFDAFELFDIALLAPIVVGVAGTLVNSRTRLKSLVGGGLV